MPHVKARVPGIVDPERHDRLPVDKWRPVTLNRYWHRLFAEGDIELRHGTPESGVEGHDDAPAEKAPRSRTAKPDADQSADQPKEQPAS